MKPLLKNITLLLILLASLLAGLSTRAQHERKYYAIEIDGVLCGYSTSDVSTAEYKGMPVLEATDSIHLMLKVLGQDMNAEIASRYMLEPGTYRVLLNEMKHSTTEAGTVVSTRTEVFDDHAIHLQKESGMVDTVEITDDLIFDNSLVSTYLVEDFIEGNAEKRSYNIYDFVRNRILEQEYTLEGEEELKLAGRTFSTLIFSIYNLSDGTRTRQWMDKHDGSTVQFEVLNRKIYLADASVIKNITTADMDNSIFARVDKKIANFMDVTYMKVKADIRSAGEAISIEQLNFPGQSFEGTVDENHIQGVFEIEPVRYDGDAAPPFPPSFENEEDLKKYLEPELFIESDHPEIIEMAEKITDGATNSWEAATRLSKWVGKEIGGAVPGGTSAINTLRIREGECGSHSRLLTALCRALGIPSRLAVGCMYSPWYGGSFGQHAWNEVYMGKDVGWIAVDATILEFDYVDAGHIKLGELTTFNPEEMEILEYHIPGAEETESSIPEEYLPYIGQYTHPQKRDVLDVMYLEGSLTIDIAGRVMLALKPPDEYGRMYAKLTDKVYVTFKDDRLWVTEIAYAMKKTDEDISIAGETPEELKPLIGPYLVFQNKLEFDVFWDKGLYMYVPGVEEARGLLKLQNGHWQDTVDKKEYAFSMNEDGSVSGMNISASTFLERGASAAWIIDKMIENKGLEAAGEEFRELWDNRALDLEKTESDLNRLGYTYLGKEQMDRALMVFKLNTETFPGSWNVYDSYGEALMVNGDTSAAITNYRKSLELNPENETGRIMLEKLNKTEIE